MTVLLRRVLNGACWAVDIVARAAPAFATAAATPPATPSAAQTAILVATL